MNIIGITSHFHDSACCLLQDGKLVAAAEEERFTRIKHDASMPVNAFNYCLEAGGLCLTDIDYVAYYENPWKKVERQLWMTIPRLGEPGLGDILQKIDPGRPEREIRETLGYQKQILYFDHHRSHAAAAYIYSGFDHSAIFTVDGVGEWTTMAMGIGNGHEIELFDPVYFPHSIGLLYSTITAYLGFEVNESEYRVMGLAPYGKPRYADHIRRLICNSQEARFELDLDYFGFLSSNQMYSQKLCDLFGRPARTPDSTIEPFHQDVAHSLQLVLEELLIEKINYLYKKTQCENLCMAGGVALNCVANSKIHRMGPFKDLFVQPSANDAGNALGAAALAYIQLQGKRPGSGRMREVYLGPSFANEAIADLLRSSSAVYSDFRGNKDGLNKTVAQCLTQGKVVGWFNGRMEFGPRALGSRSILGDPRHPQMKDKINSVIKKRESFRPFAPSVLLSSASEHFDLNHASPFMLEVCQVTSAIDMPAITHIDGSARVQTVDPAVSPDYAALIESFYQLTGCPVVLNTSFNIKGEPIVCRPEEALLCFIRTDMDCLVLNDFFIERQGLPDYWVDLFGQSMPVMQTNITHDVYTFL